MSRWTNCWTIIAAMSAAPGVVLAFMSFQAGYLVFVGGLAGLLTAVVASLTDLPSEESLRNLARRCAPIAVVTAVGLWTLIGYLSVVPILGGPLLIIVAIGSPAIGGRLWSRARAGTDDRESISRLTDAELCRLWNTTLSALASSRRGRKTIAIIACRVVVLDELADRHPRQFERWLSTVPRPDDDPTSYFAPPTAADGGTT